jgi:fatty acid desaturase
MTSASFKITNYLTRSEIQILSQPSSWEGIKAVCTSWSIIALSFTLVALHPAVWSYLLASILIGGRHLALAILMHDASHTSLFRGKKLNDWIGTWLCAAPVGHDFIRYRQHHLKHHQYTGTPQDPDRDLADPYPVTATSMARKIFRDCVGLTGIKRIYGILLMNFGYIQYTVSGTVVPLSQHGRSHLDILKLGITRFSGFLITNSILFGILWMLRHPYLYGLWVFAYLSPFSVIVRIRSIAEHACTEQNNPNPIRNTRTTYANWMARLSFAPHRVNYHLEHHLLMGVPSFRFPELHQLLLKRGALHHAQLATGYWQILKIATTPAPSVS